MCTPGEKYEMIMLQDTIEDEDEEIEDDRTADTTEASGLWEESTGIVSCM